MRSGNIELKSDLANLFKDLEEAKRDSRNVVSISKPKIDQLTAAKSAFNATLTNSVKAEETSEDTEGAETE